MQISPFLFMDLKIMKKIIFSLFFIASVVNAQMRRSIPVVPPNTPIEGSITSIQDQMFRIRFFVSSLYIVDRDIGQYHELIVEPNQRKARPRACNGNRSNCLR